MAEIWKPKSFSYGESGVDVRIEGKASRILYETSKPTWENRRGKLGQVEALYDDFRGVRFSDVSCLPEGTVMYENADGTGSKPQIARIAGRLDTISTDLIEASGCDAACEGYEPVHLVTVVKVNTLGQDESRLDKIRELGESCTEPCARAGISITNGELAQDNTMGHLDEFRFEWDGALTSFGHKSRLVDGSKIEPDNALVGFYEAGFRSNGFSLLLDIFEYYYGEEWGEEQFMGQRLADLVLTPSEMYTPALVDMTGGYDLNRPAPAQFSGAVNISGGGIPEKLSSLLKASGYGAVIDNPFKPPEAMALAQTLGRVPDKEAYRVLCMGIGLIIATEEPNNVLKVGQKHGLTGRRIGQVVSSRIISIESRGTEHPGRWLNYFI
ncbi:hypothetical protein HYW36_02055 [Candidatus Saccharibacteria bacterium]|nr:hypothetical protein [Candidatus Saccharibacteria bacterium]